MRYNKICFATFLERPNRFIARVLVDGKEEIVHVKNTGRCKELLLPLSKVVLSEGEGKNRKTKYDLIAVYKKNQDGGDELINMDSQIPNAVAVEWFQNSGFFSSDAKIKREVKFEHSRFDIFVEDGDRKVFIEVKGVTLERDRVALFPDAPTVRGERHLRELELAVNMGYEAMVIFVIQMKGVKSFRPNFQTDPMFSERLKLVSQSGVKLFAVDCLVTPDSIAVHQKVPIQL